MHLLMQEDTFCTLFYFYASVGLRVARAYISHSSISRASLPAVHSNTARRNETQIKMNFIHLNQIYNINWTDIITVKMKLNRFHVFQISRNAEHWTDVFVRKRFLRLFCRVFNMIWNLVHFNPNRVKMHIWVTGLLWSTKYGHISSWPIFYRVFQDTFSAAFWQLTNAG